MTRAPATDLATHTLARLREAAALRLWDLGAIRVAIDEPFTLASGNRSPIYVNCRRAISDPPLAAIFRAAARLLVARCPEPVDAVAGGETAGIPFAAFLAQELGCPLLYVRKKPKGHGIATRIEGHAEPGSRVLLVEDLVTDGGSKLGFVDALEASGAKVDAVLVLFDRAQGGRALLRERGLDLLAVTDRPTALRAGLDAGCLAGAAAEEVERYFADPVAWHRDRGFDWRGP